MAKVRRAKIWIDDIALNVTQSFLNKSKKKCTSHFPRWNSSLNTKTCFPFPQLKPRYPQKFRGVLEFKSSKRVFERLAVTNLRFTNCSWAFQRRTSAALRTCPYLGSRETLKPDRQIWHLLRPNNVLTYSTIDTSLLVFGCKMISKRAASSTRGQEDKKCITVNNNEHTHCHIVMFCRLRNAISPLQRLFTAGCWGTDHSQHVALGMLQCDCWANPMGSTRHCPSVHLLHLVHLVRWCSQRRHPEPSRYTHNTQLFNGRLIPGFIGSIESIV